MNTACPSSDSLRQYALGDVTEDLADQIETHLADCPVCEETIASFDSADDTLVRHLPLAAGNEGNVAADTPGWLDRLRSGPPVGQATLEPSVVADGANVPLDQFSAYELLGVLGHGGMGVVYRARHRQLNRNVALKVLSPRSTAAPEARRRFEREIQALGGLHHPGIVMATDAGRINDAAYLVMELVDGVDLAHLVRQGGPFTIAEACEAARQMAEALAAAHELGTIHRDVKPSNVMIDRRGRVKLLDFGLAHLHTLSTESLETSLGRLLGTLDYMAPEQAAGDGSPGASADLYGLGATLFFVLTGRAPRGPREGRSLVQQLRAIVDAEVPRVSTLRADVPPELDDFVARLLSRDPSDRPLSAEAVAEQLKQWAGGDLSARVIESKTNHAPDETASDNSDLVPQSLSELVGPNIARSSRSGLPQGENAAELEGKRNPAETAGLSGGGRRRWAWAAAAAGAFAAAFYGIVIVLQTPNGTLRIESDVDDIAITVVDENNKEQDMTVDHRGDETSLAAGRYRISFKGNHDCITKDRDVVTLKRGELAVVKITRTEHSHVAAVPEKYVLGSTELDWQNFLRAHRGLANIDQSCSECHRQSPLPAVKSIDLPKTADSAPGERIYSGKPESEWRRIYLAEREPNAKLEAASALLAMAAELPLEKRIEELLTVGEELVSSNAGDDPLAFAMENLSYSTRPGYNLGRPAVARSAGPSGAGGGGGSGRRGGRRAGRGAGGSGTMTQFRGRGGGAAAQNVFLDLLHSMTAALPPETLAIHLCNAAIEGRDTRAAFALALIKDGSTRWLSENAAATQIVLRNLKLPLAGLDRAAVCLLVRAGFLSEANTADQADIKASLGRLAAILAPVPEQNLAIRMRERLLQLVAEIDGWPPANRVEFARLMMQSIEQGFGQNLLPYFAVTSFGPRENAGNEMNRTPPYDARYVAAVREQMNFFLDQWLPTVNQELEMGYSSYTSTYLSQVSRDVDWTLDQSVALYSDGDNWPTDKTAAILTEKLHRYYAAELPPDDKPYDVLLPASPALMLTQIVRITGKIPDFVLAGHPRPKPTRDRLKALETLLASEQEPTQLQLNTLAGLYDDAPLEVIRLSLGDVKAVSRMSKSQYSPRGILNDMSKPKQDESGGFDGPSVGAISFPDTYVDPLLLLAALAQSGGESEAKDARIASLVGEDWFGGLKTHLSFLLASPLKARGHARRMLGEMAAKAKSPALVEAINVFGPALKESPALPEALPAASKDTSAAIALPDAGDADDKIYKGHTAREWQRLFLGETEPIAKLNAAASLLTMTEDQPAQQQIQQVLLVGEEVARMMGDEKLVYALESWSVITIRSDLDMDSMRNRGRGRGRSWGPLPTDSVAGRRFESSPEINAAYRAYLAQLQKIAEAVPADLLANEACQAAVGGAENRAAFAVGLLRDMTRKFWNEHPAAAKIALRELRVPLAALDGSAVCLLTRARLYPYADDQQERDISESLHDLAAKLTIADNGNVNNALRDSLLDASRAVAGWPPEQATGFNLIVRNALERRHDDAIDKYFALSAGERWADKIEDRPTLPYDSRYVNALRTKTQYFLNEWVPFVNDHFSRSNAPYDALTRDMVRTLDKVLPLYSDGDDWPVDQTAALLTEQLRRYYSVSDGDATGAKVDDLLPADPSLLLTQIVRITGQIPDFVRNGKPRPKDASQQVKWLEAFLASIRQNQGNNNAWRNVFELAPLQVIQLSLRDTKATPSFQTPYTPRRILFDASNDSAPNDQRYGGGYFDSSVDPLLLLAGLTEVSGQSEAQDEKVAGLMSQELFEMPLLQPRDAKLSTVGLKQHLKYLLASPLKAREHARRMLNEMAAKTKSQALVNAIKAIQNNEPNEANQDK